MPAGDLPDLSEPTPIACAFVTGGLVHVEDGSVTVVMWTALPDAEGARVQVRYGMTDSVAARLHGDLGRGLKALRRKSQ